MLNAREKTLHAPPPRAYYQIGSFVACPPARAGRLSASKLRAGRHCHLPPRNQDTTLASRADSQATKYRDTAQQRNAPSTAIAPDRHASGNRKHTKNSTLGCVSQTSPRLAIMKRKSISKFCAEFRGPRRLAAVSLNLAMIVPPAFLLVALVLGIFLVTGNHDTLRTHGSGIGLGHAPFGLLAFGGLTTVESESLERLNSQAKKFITEGETKFAEQADRIRNLEQRAVSRVDGDGDAGESLGAKIMGSPQFKDFSASGRKSTGLIQVGSFFKTALVNDTGFGQPLVVPQRLPYIVTPGLQQLRIRDLLPVLPTASNMVDYAREISFDNKAAMQGAESSPQVYENVAKAESALGFELAYQPVRTLAHWIPISKQLLDDATGLQSYLNSRLLYGLKLIEEA